MRAKKKSRHMAKKFMKNEIKMQKGRGTHMDQKLRGEWNNILQGMARRQLERLCMELTVENEQLRREQFQYLRLQSKPLQEKDGDGSGSYVCVRRYANRATEAESGNAGSTGAAVQCIAATGGNA